MTTPGVRIAIVEDHPVVREGTAAILAAQPGIVVVGTAGSLTEARALLARVEVDVVLLDIRLGAESGLGLLTATDRTSTDRPAADARPANRPAIVVLTAYDYPQYADAALRMGAAGFVLKTAPLGEIVAAIRLAAEGGLAFRVRPSGLGAELPTAREFDVVRLVVDGCSNNEIGAALGIGARTVETHLRRLFERFAIASRTELATRALREGWLEIPPS
jgi:DNA-binding NarL/FixJ family response regulator